NPDAGIDGQKFVVPDGVTSNSMEVFGAQGGSTTSALAEIGAVDDANAALTGPPVTVTGGLGGEASATLTVKPGDVLYITVGCKGEDSKATDEDGGLGGFGFGGNGGDAHGVDDLSANGYGGGGGGGLSRISLNGTAASN